MKYLVISALLLVSSIANAGETVLMTAGHLRSACAELKDGPSWCWDAEGWRLSAKDILRQLDNGGYLDGDDVLVGADYYAATHRALATWRNERAKSQEQRNRERLLSAINYAWDYQEVRTVDDGGSQEVVRSFAMSVRAFLAKMDFP